MEKITIQAVGACPGMKISGVFKWGDLQKWRARCANKTYICSVAGGSARCKTDEHEDRRDWEKEQREARGKYEERIRQENAVWTALSPADRRLICSTRGKKRELLLGMTPEARAKEPVWVAFAAFDQPTRDRIVAQKVFIGMPYSAVLMAMGPPANGNRTTTARGQSIQMVYSLQAHPRCGLWSSPSRSTTGRNVYIYVEGERVTAIQD